MHLSKVMIYGPACRNPYEIHRALWKLFPEDPDATRDYLFRVEHSGQQQAEVLMQSVRPPFDQKTAGVHLLASRQYPLSPYCGQRLRFLLLANPIKTINDENGRINCKGEIKKCRVPLIREEEWHAWIFRKLAGCAQPISLLAEKRLPLHFRKGRENRAGKVQPVCFQGILNVEAPDTFRALVISGIGPAKAFGCGLLSLARA